MNNPNTNKIKILFFIDSLRAGGKERRFSELLKRLKFNTNIDFEIVVMSRDIHYKDILNLNYPIHYLIRKTKKDLNIFRKFLKICNKYKPDIVHTWDNMTSVIAVPACKILKIRIVNGMVVDSPTIRNIFNKNWVRARITFPFSDVIIGNSKAGLSAYNAPLHKSLVINNGYNFERNQHLSSREQILAELNICTTYVVAMVATFSAKKDYKTYFEAASKVLSIRKDVTFLAIGKDTDSLAAKSLVDIKYRDKYFKFLGSKSNIESYINIADIGVLATFTEGISNAIMEFMAAKKPVLATDGGGTNEIIEDSITGFLLKARNPQDLADKIELLLKDENKRIQMGKSGQKRIKDYFSIDIMTNQYVSIYKKILLN